MGLHGKKTETKKPSVKTNLDEVAAWEAFEGENYELAERMWTQLIEEASDTGKKDNLLNSYCYTLCKLGKFEMAHLIYENLFHKKGDHIYLHQLGMVERERGNFLKALDYILKERDLVLSGKTSLPRDLALGAGCYEIGKLYELLGRKDEAFQAAAECLEYAMRGDDQIMLACAFRLWGDLEHNRDPKASVLFYEMALATFECAGDSAGAMEIEELLQR